MTFCLLEAGPKHVKTPELAGTLPENVRFDGMD